MELSRNHWIGAAAVAVVFLIIGYVIGAAYAGSHALPRGAQFGMAGQAGMGQGGGGFARGGYAGGTAGRGGAMGTGGAAGAGATTGTILSQDANSITIATQGGGSRIVLVSASTTVMTESTSSVASLQKGQTVTVLGTANSDGSVSARSIQARP
jgi:hypothetical protein